MRKLKGVSLFSGGGIGDLIAESEGIEVVAQFENDEVCLAVLKHIWPNVKRYTDIKKVKSDELRGIDIIFGGPPCQPVSCQGKRLGEADKRWLWKDMLRIVVETRPRWVFIENVPGLRTKGADAILSDLEKAAYSCQAFMVGACSIGAPHERGRVWIVAQSVADAESGEPWKPSEYEGWEDPCRGGQKVNAEAVADSDDPRGGASRYGVNSEQSKTDQGWEGQPQHRSGGLCEAEPSQVGRKINPCEFRDYYPRWPSGRDMPQYEWESPRIDLSPTESEVLREYIQICPEGLLRWQIDAASRALDRWAALAGVDKPVDGMADKIFCSSRRSCHKILGNAWVWGIANAFFRWIVEQERSGEK